MVSSSNCEGPAMPKMPCKGPKPDRTTVAGFRLNRLGVLTVSAAPATLVIGLVMKPPAVVSSGLPVSGSVTI